MRAGMIFLEEFILNYSTPILGDIVNNTTLSQIPKNNLYLIDYYELFKKDIFPDLRGQNRLFYFLDETTYPRQRFGNIRGFFDKPHD